MIKCLCKEICNVEYIRILWKDKLQVYECEHDVNDIMLLMPLSPKAFQSG